MTFKYCIGKYKDNARLIWRQLIQKFVSVILEFYVCWCAEVMCTSAGCHGPSTASTRAPSTKLLCVLHKHKGREENTQMQRLSAVHGL